MSDAQAQQGHLWDKTAFRGSFPDAGLAHSGAFAEQQLVRSEPASVLHGTWRNGGDSLVKMRASCVPIALYCDRLIHLPI